MQKRHGCASKKEMSIREGFAVVTFGWTFFALFGALPGGFLLMILTSILLFAKVRQPLIIWLTVPLAIIGITAGMFVSVTSFDITTFEYYQQTVIPPAAHENAFHLWSIVESSWKRVHRAGVQVWDPAQLAS